jgi:small subunit ribosomal protein S16
VVATEKENARDGRVLEILGHYNPRTEPATIKVDERRLFHWIKNGAKPSDSVFRALKTVGTWDRWERFKQGEAAEVLAEDAQKAYIEVDPKTRRGTAAAKRPSKKTLARAEAAKAAEG